MYHVMPHRVNEDPAEDQLHLEFAKDHATLESAQEEAKRICSIGWSAHIWEDANPQHFIESWDCEAGVVHRSPE